MGIFSILNMFRGKKEDKFDDKDDYSSIVKKPAYGTEGLPRAAEPPPLQSQIPTTAPMNTEAITHDNMRAKLDLMATQIDSMRMQQESMNQRVVDIEAMLKELLIMAKED